MAAAASTRKIFTVQSSEKESPDTIRLAHVIRGLTRHIGTLDFHAQREAMRDYVEQWGLMRSWYNDEKLNTGRRPLAFVSFLNDQLADIAPLLALALADQAGQPQASGQEIVVYQACNMSDKHPVPPVLCNVLVLVGHGAPGEASLGSTAGAPGSAGHQQFSFERICDTVNRMKPRLVVLLSCDGANARRGSLLGELAFKFPDKFFFGCREKLLTSTCFYGLAGSLLNLLYHYCSNTQLSFLFQLFVENIAVGVKRAGLANPEAMTEWHLVLLAYMSYFHSHNQAQQNMLELTTVDPKVELGQGLVTITMDDMHPVLQQPEMVELCPQNAQDLGKRAPACPTARARKHASLGTECHLPKQQRQTGGCHRSAGGARPTPWGQASCPVAGTCCLADPGSCPPCPCPFLERTRADGHQPRIQRKPIRRSK